VRISVPQPSTWLLKKGIRNPPPPHLSRTTRTRVKCSTWQTGPWPEIGTTTGRQLLPRREWVVHAVSGGAFIVVAVLLAVIAQERARGLRTSASGSGPFAVTGLARFEHRLRATRRRRQLVLVQMMLHRGRRSTRRCSPGRMVAGRTRRPRGGKTHIFAAGKHPGNCCVRGRSASSGPSPGRRPDWSDWPLYLLALGRSSAATDLQRRPRLRDPTAGGPIDWGCWLRLANRRRDVAESACSRRSRPRDHPFAFLG